MFSEDIQEIELENITLLVKWNWDYQECLDLQHQLVKEVQADNSKRYIILTSHPHVFTHGRGLQKGKEVAKLGLQDFQQSTSLPFPLFHIKRGGGLTFHYPGQYIVYPILKLNSDKMTMKNVINELLHLTQTTLEETFQIDELTTENALLGLWREKKKLASVGVALDRYVTFHGLALNLEFDDKMKSVLAHLFPCGISSDTYQDVASLTNSSNLAPAFHESFVKNLSSSLFNS